MGKLFLLSELVQRGNTRLLELYANWFETRVSKTLLAKYMRAAVNVACNSTEQALSPYTVPRLSYIALTFFVSSRGSTPFSSLWEGGTF